MTIALWCVFVAALLPFPFTLAAKWSRRFDNARPRSSLEQNQGWRQRANWAQLNSFEAFPAFAAAVIISHVVKGPLPNVDALALAFIALRVAFGLLYIADKATLRSLAWTAAIGCTIAIFLSAA
ncbi:MAG TPA: MAPEG family protein [Solimonas sp.]|nr:MAPEG family protein [Solimonas sp.]